MVMGRTRGGLIPHLSTRRRAGRGGLVVRARQMGTQDEVSWLAHPCAPPVPASRATALM